MVIKATRIRTSSGAGPLLRHLADGDDNEAAAVVAGTMADIRDCVEEARRFGRAYCIRHFIIAPGEDITAEQFGRAADMLAEEFGFDRAAALIVEHVKGRAAADASRRHWHVVVPEVDAAGRVLSSKHDRLRHEKLSRLLEIEFGHRITPGAHDLAVIAALRSEGRKEQADRLAAALGHSDRPTAAFHAAEHQAAKRAGLDLALVRQHVRLAFANAGHGRQFRALLAEHGLSLSSGDKPGRWIITTSSGTYLGAGHRLAGAKMHDFNRTMENSDDNHPAHDSSTGNLGRGSGDPRGPEHDPQVGRGNRAADAGPADVVSGRRYQLAAHDGGRNPAASAVGIGTTSPSGRAGDSGSLAPDGRTRLIEAIRHSVMTAKAISAGPIAASPTQLLARSLGEMERKAHADIAAAKAAVAPSSSRLDAMRLLERGTGQRHDDLLRRYQELEAVMGEPASRYSWLDRALGRPAPPARNLDAMTREHSALRSEVIQAERQVLSAIAAVARAEKEYSAANVQRMTTMEASIRSAEVILTEVAQVRQLVQVYPRVIYCGPKFAIQTGQRIARQRKRGLAHPMAKNIWGLPVDFG